MNRLPLLIAIICVAMLAACPVACGQNKSSFDQALAAYNKHDYRQAAQLFERCLTTSGADATVAYYCALANMGNHNNARGKQLLHYVITSFPQSKEAEYARTTLSKIETPGGGNAVSASQTSTEASAEPESSDSDPEYAGLPRTAKFRFKRGEQGHMVVDAYINNHPLAAWFDTGANCLIGKSDLVALGVRPPDGPPTSKAKGWAGVTVPTWRMPLKIRLGDLTRTVDVAVIETENAEGITKALLGQSFIAGYRYSIDQQGGWVNLTKNETAADATGAGSGSINRAYEVPCRKEMTKDFVPLEINGKTIWVFIDTGAAGTIFDEQTFESLGIAMPADAPVVRRSGVGGLYTCRQVQLDLRLGPINRLGFTVNVGGKTKSCVGQDFLEGWRFTVDQDRGVLRFFH